MVLASPVRPANQVSAMYVDDVDDLADDRGQSHGQEDFWIGVGGKDALFSGAWVHPFLQR